jgi:hydrogenase-4 membrane subunit HyfE
MTVLETSLALYWGLMAIASATVAVRRRPLARWLLPRMRYWRSRANAQHLYERSMLIAGIAMLLVSLGTMYHALVVLPGLDRALSEVFLTASPACPTDAGDAI